MRIRVDYALLGTELKPYKNVCIDLSIERIENIEVDCKDVGDIYIPSSVAIPPLCNAHVHALDFVLHEYGESKELKELVSFPYGLKYKLLEEQSNDELVRGCTAFLWEALKCGVVALGLYVELGEQGIKILEQVPENKPVIKYFPQPSPRYHSIEHYLSLLQRFRALGLDTLLTLSEYELSIIESIACKIRGVVAVHVSETSELYSLRDYERLSILKHSMIIHGTYLDDNAYSKYVYSQSLPWIICPRSNYYHIGKAPSISLVLKHYKAGMPIAIGTDNAAWFNPSPLDEISFAYTIYRTSVSNRLELAKMLLHAATIGCFQVLNLKYSGIAVNALPIILVLQSTTFRYSHDIVISAVKHGIHAEKILVVGKDVIPLYSIRVQKSKSLNTVLNKLRSL